MTDGSPNGLSRPVDHRRPWVIAVIGGVGSGKSTVARQLESLGAVRVDADEVAHEVLDEPEVRRALVSRYGHEILGPDARVDRQKLAKLIFGPAPAARAERHFVQDVIHPRVKERILSRLVEADRQDVPAIVLDVPLLVEVGWQDLADEIIFVDADPEIRAQRATRRGWSRAEWEAREGAQAAIETKHRAASTTISNNGSLEDLRQAVTRWWRKKSAEKGLRDASKRS